jgi:threonine dehydrogenase-like Zn-dependent dehydrogenase
MKILGATPVLFVDRVEPTRDFFLRAGFQAIVEVPAGDAVGFAILQKDGVQVMVETRGNAAEPPAMQYLSRDSRRAAIFIEVDDLETVIRALEGATIAVDRHPTFYGADELTFEEPGGNLVTFAKIARPS